MLAILTRKGNNVFIKTTDKRGRTYKDFEHMSANPLASMDENVLRRYIMGYGEEMANIQDCLYSRWFVIPGRPCDLLPGATRSASRPGGHGHGHGGGSGGHGHGHGRGHGGHWTGGQGRGHGGHGGHDSGGHGSGDGQNLDGANSMSPSRKRPLSPSSVDAAHQMVVLAQDVPMGSETSGDSDLNSDPDDEMYG